FGASLVGFYHGVRVAHVEAGLRTGDMRRPFPEEANRRIVDLLAGACFAPTERARRNLLREGVDPQIVHVTGNTVIDALHYVVRCAYDLGSGPLASVPFDRRIVLVTAHRRESFGPGFVYLGRARRRPDCPDRRRSASPPRGRHCVSTHGTRRKSVRGWARERADRPDPRRDGGAWDGGATSEGSAAGGAVSDELEQGSAVAREIYV